jgi:hypothetical protein
MMTLDRVIWCTHLGVGDQSDNTHHNQEHYDAGQIDQVVEVVGVEVSCPFPCTGGCNGPNILQELVDGRVHLGLILSVSKIVDTMLLLSAWIERAFILILQEWPCGVITMTESNSRTSEYDTAGERCPRRLEKESRGELAQSSVFERAVVRESESLESSGV